MNILLRQLVSRFNRLTYPQKFNIISLIFILPILGFLPLVREQIARVDQYGRKELFGVLYLRPVWQLREDLQTHEDLYQQFVEGKVAFSIVEAAQTVIEDDFDLLISRHNEYRENLPLENEAEVLRSQWLSLQSAVAQGDTTAIEAGQASISNSISDLVIHVGDISSLILDPDLDTYYMMDITLLRLPQNQALVYQVHQMIVKAETDKGLSERDQTALRILLIRIRENMDEIDGSIERSLTNNRAGNMSPLVSTPHQEYKIALLAFVNNVDALLESDFTIQNANFKTDFDSFRSANNAFYDGASNALEAGISARINAWILSFYTTGLITLFGAIAAFYMGQGVMQRVSKPLIQLGIATQQIAAGDLTTRVEVENKEDELGRVAEAFNRMAQELETERTALITRSRELETANTFSAQQAQKLLAISEISRAISSEQSLQYILPLVARLISEKFNFYHVGIFLMEEPLRQFAVLQASNSPGGQHMLERGHRLALGQGVVGYAATGTARIALDVGLDAAYFNNPDLPHTRSEMALPLRVSGEVIGVLDVQSTQPNAFKDQDVDVLSTLADQVAIAIQNARSYETTQKLLEDAQKSIALYVQDAWNTQNKTLGYLLSGSTLNPLDAPMDIALFSKLGANGEAAIENGEKAKLAVPIRLAGNIVGVVHVQLPEEHEWEPDEIDIAQAVADRLSLALEAATLLEATRKRAEIERLTADITGRIGATTQFDSILRTAAEELSRVLGGSDVLVQIQGK